MTELEARRIYRARYFTGTGFDQVKDPQLLEFLFDYGVNSGVGAPASALQAVLRRTHVQGRDINAPACAWPSYRVAQRSY